LSINTDEVIAAKPKMSKGNMVRSVVILIIGFTLWWNKYAIYAFVNDVLNPSPILWQGYTIEFGEENRVLSNDDMSLSIVNKKDPSSSLRLRKYDSVPASPQQSITSYCGRKDCSSLEEGVVNIDGQDALFAKANFKEEEVKVIEFIHLPNSTIKLTINTPVAYYENLHKIATALHK